MVSAATSVVSDHMNGSQTDWPGALLFRIGQRMHSTGFRVSWTVSESWCRDEICQGVVCLRSPARGAPCGRRSGTEASAWSVSVIKILGAQIGKIGQWVRIHYPLIRSALPYAYAV